MMYLGLIFKCKLDKQYDVIDCERGEEKNIYVVFKYVVGEINWDD